MAQIQQPNIEELRMRSGRSADLMRLFAFLLACFLCILILRKLYLSREYFSLFYFLMSLVLSALVADFISGVAHWTFDTWGSAKTFIVGPLFIRPFREHHGDEKAFTHHTFLQTSSSGSFTVIPFLFIILFLPLEGMFSYALLLFLFFVTTWIFLTNQIHKWAHMETPPALIAFLQKIHILLPNEAHHIHHIEPFTQSYAITNGWTNPFFTKFKFFTKLEKIIMKITGAVPRTDDIGIEAAREVMAKEK
ncbi:MAG: fatty acid desaturase CarF family protein [Candidatus Pacebacteria bacterium]|nr:fatty acid desaturase CarF family protein [Candidatus Paceibacterota bacterium]